MATDAASVTTADTIPGAITLTTLDTPMDTATDMATDTATVITTDSTPSSSSSSTLKGLTEKDKGVEIKSLIARQCSGQQDSQGLYNIVAYNSRKACAELIESTNEPWGKLSPAQKKSLMNQLLQNLLKVMQDYPSCTAVPTFGP